jgi:hypothetical protein
MSFLLLLLLHDGFVFTRQCGLEKSSKTVQGDVAAEASPVQLNRRCRCCCLLMLRRRRPTTHAVSLTDTEEHAGGRQEERRGWGVDVGGRKEVYIGVRRQGGGGGGG